MSELIPELKRQAIQAENAGLVKARTNTAEWEAADLIEQQQQRNAELETQVRSIALSRDELAATVERLREVVWSDRKSLMVKVDCEKILQATPQQNLNGIKREAYREGFMSCADEYGLESTYASKEGIVRKVNECTNQRYPVKDGE